jgi:integrase
MRGSTFKRCACRDESGRQLGKACPRLGQKRHGTWYLVMGLPAGPDGKRRQLKRGGFATKAEAEAELDRLRARSGRGEQVEVRQTTGDWLTYWLAEKTKTTGASAVGKPIRPTTARVYRQHVEQYLIPKLGHVVLNQLRSEHISAAYDELLAERTTMGPTTLRRVHACLSSALNAAVKARRLDFSPAQHVHLPDATRPKVQPWQPEQLGAFLDHVAGHRLGSLYLVMAATGLRRGEALGLRWSDVEIDAGLIVVRRQLIQLGRGVEFGPIKTRSGEDRIVELDRGTLGVLLEHRLRQDSERAEWGSAYLDDGLVFAKDGGEPLSPEYVTKTFTRLAAAAGVPHVRLHDLRHGAASLRLAAGVDIAAVSKMLGHSSISITADTYSHLLRGVGRQAAEAAMALVPRGNGSGTGVPTSFPHQPGNDSGRPPRGENGQVSDGAPSGTRTPNPLIKSQLLCQLS